MIRCFYNDGCEIVKNRWASIFFAVMTGLVLGGCDGDDNNDESASITTVERPWIKEAEFQQDSSLHALLDQTVILDLEPASAGDTTLLLRNTLRIIVSDTESLGFCIPAQEPHITALELVSEQGATLLRVTRGSNCPAVELEAGRYTLHVIHDASTIDPPGQLAFFRRNNQPQVVLDSSEATAPPWDFFTFKGPNGKYVGLANPESNPGAVAATADTVTPATVFLTGNLGMVGSTTCTPETLSLVPFSATPVAGLAWFPSSASSGTLFPDEELLAIEIGANAAAVTSACHNALNSKFGACVVSFSINDLGDYAIHLESTDYCVEGTATTPIYLDDFDVLKLQPESENAATEFTVDYKGFLCGGGTCTSSDLNLQTGEVAVFAECNFKGPAIVFAADVPNFDVYNDAPADASGFIYGIKDNAAASIMPGPDTLVELWTNPAGSSTNTVYGIPADTACLSGTPVDGQVSQLKIVGTKQYITDTGGCNNCNLTGVDLSNTDLSSKSFINAIFTSANLTSASFKSSTLKDADFSGSETQLSGTAFSSATLACTNFSSTDLSVATFGANTFTTDFSCRMSLASATLDYSTFSDDDWRYFDLTGSTVNNVPDTLSSSTAPLDLSGAMLANVTWLQGIAVDFVNLGCFPGTSSTPVCPAQGSNSKVCATLTGTVLSNASLMNACLQGAQLQGAFLDFTNLALADLSDAQLLATVNGKPATLDGAFLRDATIENADLSGVSMVSANFFNGLDSANASGATLTDANLTGAYLAGADFSDAILHGTTWTGAVLAATNFTGADLSADTSGFTSSFDGAYMQGAVFVNADVSDVNFTSSYWDISGVAHNLNYLLPTANLQFTGVAAYVTNLSADVCVQAAYPASATANLPSTDNLNTCPDGIPGPCTNQQWEDPKTPFSGTGSQSQAAIDPAFPAASTCTVADILWNF